MTTPQADPVVSVIVPCYGQARFLRENIASLMRQSLRSWEAIIVDDGSPDDTAQVAASLVAADGRVRYLKKANGGLASARNAGLQIACGEFIQLLDADDGIEPRKLELQSSFLREHGTVDLVFGDACYFDDTEPVRRFSNGLATSTQRLGNELRERASSSGPMMLRLLRNNLFPVCAPLLRRGLIDRVGGFNEGLRRLEDWEYWIRCAAQGLQAHYLEVADTACHIRVHGDSMSSNALQMRQWQFDLALAVLPHLRSAALTRRAALLATDGLEAVSDVEHWRNRLTALQEAIEEPGAARWLDAYAALGKRLPLRSAPRQLAYRLARRVARWRLQA